MQVTDGMEGHFKRAGAEPAQNKGETAMHLKHLALGLAVVMAIPATATAAKAADGLYIPLFSYRTGPGDG